MPWWRRPRIVREGGGEVKSRQRLSSAVGRRLFSSSISWYCPSTTTHWPWLACWFTCGHLRDRRCPHTAPALPRIAVLGRLVSSCASRCNQPSSTQDTHQSYSCSVPIPTTFCPASAVLAKPYPRSLFLSFALDLLLLATGTAGCPLFDTFMYIPRPYLDLLFVAGTTHYRFAHP